MTVSGVMGFVDGVSRGRLHGWAFDPHHPGRRLAVTIGLPKGQTCVVLADRYRADLQRHGYGDGHYGFSLPASAELASQIAAHAISGGDTIPLQGAGTTQDSFSAASRTFHIAAGRLHIDDVSSPSELSGWAQQIAHPRYRVMIQIKLDGRIFEVRRATLFRRELVTRSCDGFHGFVIPLPVSSIDARCEVIAFGMTFELR